MATQAADHYARLPDELRAEFDRQVHVFVTTERITGVEVDVTAEMRLLVAASAVILTVGWPGFEWRRLAEVLLYPQDFDVDYGFDTPRPFCFTRLGPDNLTPPARVIASVVAQALMSLRCEGETPHRKARSSETMNWTPETV